MLCKIFIRLWLRMIKTNEYYGKAVSELNGIPDAAWLFIFGVLAVICVVFQMERHGRHRQNRARKSAASETSFARHTGAPFAKYKTPTHTTLYIPAQSDLRDPKQQMEAIARVDFEITPLLNKEEARLLPLLESCTRKLNRGHRVMAQTSLGEIIRPKAANASNEAQRAAFASINSKRLDFAIFDRFGRLAIAIEYQGSGHYQTKSFMRDAVKREALRKAGVPYLEVKQDFSHDDVARQITQLLAPTDQANTTATPGRS